MDLSTVKKHAKSLLAIDGTSYRDVRWGPHSRKLNIGSTEYKLPTITHVYNGNRVVAQAIGPNELLEAMQRYAEKVTKFEPTTDGDFPYFFTKTEVPFGDLKAELHGIKCGGTDYSDSYHDKGFPALVDAIEQVLNERQAFIEQIFEEQRKLLSKPENVPDDLKNLIQDTTIWREDILPKLKKNEFVKGHIEMAKGIDSETKERATPESRLAGEDRNAAQAVLKGLVVEARNKQKA